MKCGPNRISALYASSRAEHQHLELACKRDRIDPSFRAVDEEMVVTEPRSIAFACAFVIAACALLPSVKRKEIEYEVPETKINMQYAYVPGFFQHDQQPAGPEEGFRAVRPTNIDCRCCD